MVFYRKYRPKNISELDLASVRDKLSQLLTSGDIPHAFLFTGPKGLGKTSSARILAKAINCESKDGFEPCNNCDICTSITNGSHVDVLEIDAASNRGIDEIRELRERIKYSPASLTRKIYIIDEVHMLTTEAFNALLKTLEEPPSHVAFILCTTEEWKVPATITSRTFHVRFEKPSKEELLRSLNRIIEGEKIDIEDKALEYVYVLSDGAFRDAAKALEELAFTANGGKITEEIAEKTFHLGSIDSLVNSLIGKIAEKNMIGALEVLQKAASSGADFKIVTEKIVDVLHEQLLIKSKLSEGEDLEGFAISDIKKILELANTAYGQLKFSVLPQLPLEIAVMDYFMTGNSAADVPVIAATREKTTVVSIDEKGNTEKSSHTVAEVSVGSDKSLLYKIVDIVKKENHMLAGILRGCAMTADDTTLVIVPSSSFHNERINDPKAKSLIETAAKEILGKTITLKVQTKI